MPFTKDELAAMAAADAEIEAGFIRTREDLELSLQLDRRAAFDAMDNKERIVAARWQRYHQKHREEINARQRAYYAANREEILGQQHEYYKANTENIRARQRAYRETNREKLIDQQRAYYQANRGEINAKRRAQYAEIKAAQA